MLPYLLPYRVRWIAMVLIALASLAATIAIPLMTKAVIDGPVRHQDQQGLWLLGAAAMGVGISEAVLWFIRRWLVARATMGVEADIRKDLYARLQILPMSFHGRWQSGQLLSRIMNDLGTIRRFMSFGMVFLLLNVIQITVVTAILLAMYWPLGVVVLLSIVPIAATVLHFQREYTRLSRLAQDQSGHVATHVEESALGLRVVKSFGREDYVYDRFDDQLTDLYDTQVSRVSVSAKFWTLLEVIPNLTLIVVLGFGAYAATAPRSSTCRPWRAPRRSRRRPPPRRRRASRGSSGRSRRDGPPPQPRLDQLGAGFQAVARRRALAQDLAHLAHEPRRKRRAARLEARVRARHGAEREPHPPARGIVGLAERDLGAPVAALGQALAHRVARGLGLRLDVGLAGWGADESRELRAQGRRRCIRGRSSSPARAARRGHGTPARPPADRAPPPR